MIQPPGGVALLARGQTVRLQNLGDERRNRAELWPAALRVMVLGWQCAADRLAHQAPMHAKLRRHTRDRADAKLMLPTKLEPRRVCRRPFGLSHAAMACSLNCA